MSDPFDSTATLSRGAKPAARLNPAAPLPITRTSTLCCVMFVAFWRVIDQVFRLVAVISAVASSDAPLSSYHACRRNVACAAFERVGDPAHRFMSINFADLAALQLRGR
jgi:hypothetical protein